MEDTARTADEPGSKPRPVTRPDQASPRGSAVVVGYDGSPTARAAVDLAADRAARRGCRLVIVHAGEDGRVLDGLMLQTEDRLAGLDWRERAVPGNAARVLLRVAEEEDAEEIVVGSRGCGRTSAAFGRTVGHLVGGADRPVTVVPARSRGRLEPR